MSLDLNGQDGSGKEKLPAEEISEKNENRGNAAEKFSSAEKPKETEEGTAAEAKGYVFDFGDSANGTPPVAAGPGYGAQNGGYAWENGYGNRAAGGDSFRRENAAQSGGKDKGVSPDLYEKRRGMFASEERPPKKKKSVGKIVACCAGALAIAAAGFFGGFFAYQGMLDPEMRSLIWAKDQVQSNYYEEIDDQTIYDALFGALNGLLDPYSGYLTADEYADMIEDATGKWSGLGVTFSTKDAEENKRLLITRVSGNSPAEEAGILPGMCIVGFGMNEQELTESESYDELSVFLNERAAGENFVLKLRQGEDGEPFFKTVSKQSFVENYVFYRSNDSAYIFTGEQATDLTKSDNYLASLDEETAYIRLTQFNGKAAEEFAAAMDIFRSEKKKNLVLDLRANGGGYLNILNEIAGYFCKSSNLSAPVVAVANYRSGKTEEFKATGNRYFEYFAEDSEITVMADNGTASASECLIGAMVDYGAVSYENIYLSTRSGETKTYGKGIMQSTLPRTFLGKSDAIKLTTARILWPLTKNCIHGIGIRPEDGAHTVAENYQTDAEILEVVKAVCGQ